MLLLLGESNVYRKVTRQFDSSSREILPRHLFEVGANMRITNRTNPLIWFIDYALSYSSRKAIKFCFRVVEVILGKHLVRNTTLACGIALRLHLCRPLRGLLNFSGYLTPGLRSRLNSAAIFDGSLTSTSQMDELARIAFNRQSQIKIGNVP